VKDGADRRLYADTVDPDVSVLFARAADVPEYVHDGAAAMGVTGYDQVRESGRELVELLDLGGSASVGWFWPPRRTDPSRRSRTSTG
jgi:ATP phosphoribosyltransferase